MAEIVCFAMIYTLHINVLDWDGVRPDPSAGGLANHAKIVEDPVLWRSLG